MRLGNPISRWLNDLTIRQDLYNKNDDRSMELLFGQQPVKGLLQNEKSDYGSLPIV